MPFRFKVSDYKVMGGKLVRVRMIEENGTVKSVQISGDFFLVPEDSLPQLEKVLKGATLEASEVKNLVNHFFETRHTQMLGVSSGDIVHALLLAKEEVIA